MNVKEFDEELIQRWKTDSKPLIYPRPGQQHWTRLNL